MKQEYLVKDLYEAAYLQSIKQPLLRLKKEADFFWFVFQDKEICEILASGYWSGKAEGNIKDFADSIKNLKERLFAQK